MSSSAAVACKQSDMYYRLSPVEKYVVAWFDLPEYNDERDQYIQTGVRPCVIVSNDFCNRSKGDVITVVPITTSTTKVPLPTHYYIDDAEARKIGLKRASTVLGEGITSISKRRMLGTVGYIRDVEVRKAIDRTMAIQLGLVYLLKH